MKKKGASSVSYAFDAIALARSQFLPSVRRLMFIRDNSNNPMAVIKAVQLLMAIGRFDSINEPVRAEINLVKVNCIDETGGGGFTGIPELSMDES